MINEILNQAEVVTPAAVTGLDTSKELEVGDFLPCRPACD